MGVCINYKLGQRKENVKSTLDRAEDLAMELKKQADVLGISFEINRHNDRSLYVDIGGCETVTFDFKTYKQITGEEGWTYQKATLGDFGDKEISFSPLFNSNKDLLWWSMFCKTQYAGNIIEHKWVADLVRMVAMFCEVSVVYDEGDYYHSGMLQDAVEGIKENGKLIDAIGCKLQAEFGSENVIKGGVTKVGRKNR